MHRITSSSQRFGIGSNFLQCARINIIDAVLDTSGDNIAAVIPEAVIFEVCAQPASALENSGNHFINTFPVSAQADSRNGKFGFSKPSILHIRIVAAGFLCFTELHTFASGCAETCSKTRCGRCTVAHKLAAG